MLRLPREPGELMSLLSSLVRLTLGNDDFKKELRAWLDSENKRIAKRNTMARDDITFRWNQGACQLLEDLFEIIDTSREIRETLEEKRRTTEM